MPSGGKTSLAVVGSRAAEMEEAAVPGWKCLAWKEGKGQHMLRAPREWRAGFEDPEHGVVGVVRCSGR